MPLPPELPHGASLVGLTPAPDGFLLAVRDQRRGLALWLDADLSVSRTAGFPGAWSVDRVHALGTGLALRWRMDHDSRLHEASSSAAGYATWTPGQPWQVGLVGCDDYLWDIAVLDGQLYGESWSMDEDDGVYRLGLLP